MLLERGAGYLGPLVDDVVGDAGLDGDDAHRVGDDVVEVAGDPQPLGADRPAFLLRLLLDEATCLVGCLLGLSVGLVELVAASGPAGLQVLPGQPGHGDGEQGTDPRRCRRHARRLEQQRAGQPRHAGQVHHQRSAPTGVERDREHQREGCVPGERAVAAQGIADQGQVGDHDRGHREPAMQRERTGDDGRPQVGGRC